MCVCVCVVEGIIDTYVSRLNFIETILGACLTLQRTPEATATLHLQVPGQGSAFSFIRPKMMQLKDVVAGMLERGR